MHNNLSTSSFSSADTINAMQALSEAARKMPTVVVMTDATFNRVKKKLAEKTGSALDDTMQNTAFEGLPIEHYPTMTDCLDRVHQAHSTERVLLAIEENIPVECFDHPYFREQVERLRKADLDRFSMKLRDEVVQAMREKNGFGT